MCASRRERAARGAESELVAHADAAPRKRTGDLYVPGRLQRP
jgi:hypothetical protein